MKEKEGADTNLKSLAGLVSELRPSLLNWWRVAVLFFGERGRKGGGSPSAPSVSLVGNIDRVLHSGARSSTSGQK